MFEGQGSLIFFAVLVSLFAACRMSLSVCRLIVEDLRVNLIPLEMLRHYSAFMFTLSRT